MIAKRDIISPLPLIQHPPALLYHQLMAVNCPKQLGFAVLGTGEYRVPAKTLCVFEK
jgi:hypothetical protein